MNVERICDNIVAAVERERQKRGVSMRKLFFDCAVTKQPVQRCKYHKTLPNVHSLAQMCETLRISPNEMLGWNENTRRFDAREEQG